jgi:hypothetical protein
LSGDLGDKDDGVGKADHQGAFIGDIASVRTGPCHFLNVSSLRATPDGSHFGGFKLIKLGECCSRI